MDLSVFFAGTAGSVPTARRGLPAVLVRRGGDQLLFDCGEGTQRQLLRSVGLADLDAVFLTHFHTDHWLGLPGMLKTFELRARERPLAVYGPPGLNDLMKLIRRMVGRVSYPFEWTEIDVGETVDLDGYAVAPFRVRHGNQAIGYAIVEPPRPGRFDPALAEKLGVKPGPDFGRLQRGETVNGVTPDQVMGEGRPGRKIVLSGDTAPCETLAVAAHEADVLIHEATFLEDEAERAAETNHSTARQAATIARDANVRMLALVHVSTRYAGAEIREEAREVFPETYVPRDFDAIDVPFAERGTPAIHRYDEPAPGAVAGRC
jgi:ribonuclease Z